MRKPTEAEGVICPDSNQTDPRTPDKVYEISGADGKKHVRGILKSHKTHDFFRAKDCPWGGLPVPVVAKPSPKKEVQPPSPPIPADWI